MRRAVTRPALIVTWYVVFKPCSGLLSWSVCVPAGSVTPTSGVWPALFHRGSPSTTGWLFEIQCAGLGLLGCGRRRSGGRRGVGVEGALGATSHSRVASRAQRQIRRRDGGASEASAGLGLAAAGAAIAVGVMVGDVAGAGLVSAAGGGSAAAAAATDVGAGASSTSDQHAQADQQQGR